MRRMAQPEAGHGRVAVISLHTSPLDPPGAGDSGGMNVYIRSVADRLADFDVSVDIYTRCAGRGVPEIDRIGPLTRVIQVPAGPCSPMDKMALPDLVPWFTERVLTHPAGGPYDLIHAHYWLSGWAGREAKRRWGVPLVASFHTLGRVKNLSSTSDQAVEPRARLDGEGAAIGAADRILVPTPAEGAHLVRLYDAPSERIRVVPPGVDAGRFRPLPKAETRKALGLTGRRVVLFVGRLQALKGPDLAIRAVAEAVRRDPSATRDVVLAVVGGPSGPGDPLAGLRRLAGSLGISDRVRFLAPRAHEDLPEVYSAADVLVMPSRSESFGLVALEAQACGVPVVAAAVGGLRYVIRDGRSGLLVPDDEPASYAELLLRVLGDRAMAARLSRAAVANARRFPWEVTAADVLSVYRELVQGIGAADRLDDELPA
jgi:D-inositol-3-phosphate glycosyltransferase